MSDEYIYLWAQWGILTCDRHLAVLRKYGDLEKAWHEVTPQFLEGLRMSSDSVKVAMEIKAKISFEQIQDIVKRFKAGILYVEDDEYPYNLKNLSKPPPFLFVRGELPSFHKSISIVGTRAHSDYGRNSAQKFTADLVREGFVIVSGLALGIDSISHRTAIENGGITVAVLGSGVDKIYPSSNYRLAQDILSSNGAIVSAFPLGTQPFPHHFPRRNMVIAGLTQGALVIEGGRKSGALITADQSLKEGRSVFAIPCNIASLALSGTNNLIRNSEAKLVENVDHILEDFGLKGTFMKEAQDFNQDERVILEKLANSGRSMDKLFEETTYNIPELANILVGLQLKGVVTQEYNKWVLA